jgi:hypothetical protein
MPVTVAERSKSCAVFAGSEAGIVGSNPTQGMDVFFSGVGLSPLGTAATSGLLYKPQMIDEGGCEAIGRMKIGSGNRSTRRKPAPSATLSTTNPT